MNGVCWLLVLGIPLLLVQRRLHQEIQLLFYVITRRGEVALALFSLLFFPGVLLHELSHYVAARLLGVHTGRLSLVPRPMKDGRLRLGYVETGQTDLVRDSLIGVAPLLSGGTVVAYAGLVGLGLSDLPVHLATPVQHLWREGMERIYCQPDFWLWFYLTFTVSSTMLPSSTDRRAWLPLGLVLLSLLGAVILAGAGPWLAAHFSQPLDRAIRIIALVFGISLALHVILLVPIWLARWLLSKMRGFRLV